MSSRLIITFLAFALKSTLSFAGESPAALIKLGDGKYYSSTAIVVDKSKRKLTVWSKLQNEIHQIAEFPSDLGKNEGDKISRGDYKTPEGVYFLEKLLEGPGLSFTEYGVRAFTTNYPNLFDKRDGKTGDGIWLHAIPDTVSLERGSRGCVVVRNDAILEISKFVKLGSTPIIIADSVSLLNDQEKQRFSSSVESTISAWKAAWESKNIDNYIAYYDENFEALGMTKDKWRQYKLNLNEKYQKISVNFSEPVIYRHGNKIVVRALQRYDSDRHQDFGEKIIYMVERGNNELKIVGEEWAPIQNSEALQATLLNLKQTASANN